MDNRSTDPASPQDAFIRLWQNYCDVKEEAAQLRGANENLRATLADPPADVQELVLRKLRLWPPPKPVQTEVCPVCRTVHDKPLCPQSQDINLRLRTALQEAADALRNMGCAVDADAAEDALAPAPETEAHPAAELIQGLARFAQHASLCPVEQWMPQDAEDFDIPDCTCGLALLLGHAKHYTPQLGSEKTSANPDAQDAARYRWIRDADPMLPWVDPALVPTLQGADLDQRIDAAIAADTAARTEGAKP